MSHGKGIAAGYAALALLALVLALSPRRSEVPVDPEERLARAIFRSADARVAACASASGESANLARGRLVRSLVWAVVAVESHSRPRYLRTLKWVLADVHLAVTGTLPHLSLGPGQMKPTTAARVLIEAGDGPAVSMADIRRRLSDECAAVRLVGLYFETALGDIHVPDGPHLLGDARVRHRVVEAVQRYNGQARRARCAGETCDLYSALVLRLAERDARLGRPS